MSITANKDSTRYVVGIQKRIYDLKLNKGYAIAEFTGQGIMRRVELLKFVFAQYIMCRILYKIFKYKLWIIK